MRIGQHVTREVKFRAKALDGRGWVSGYYVVLDIPYIVIDELHEIAWFERFIPVNPETLGRWTGLRDKNGTEIYEGDIVRATIYVIEDRHNGAYKPFVGPVFYDARAAAWKFVFQFWHNVTDIEVLGNIHENPDLLEETK